jgi:hypothetical protein
MTTSNKLMQAIEMISLIAEKEVVGIQFEDGSGKKFNVQLKGSEDWLFYDLSDTLYIVENSLGKSKPTYSERDAENMAKALIESGQTAYIKMLSIN